MFKTVALVGFSALALSLGPSAPRPADRTVELKRLFATLDESCDYFCVPCLYSEHSMIATPWPNKTSAHEESCDQGSCDLHDDCGGVLAPDASVLFDELANTDSGAMLALVAEIPQLLLSASGEQVFVVGCNGGIIASIPVRRPRQAALDK